MTVYELLKFLHVSAAIIWVGGGFGLFLLSERFARTRDHAGQAAFGRQMRVLSRLLFMPAAVATLLFGVWMVAITGAFGFADLWILIGFAGVAVSVALGVALVQPAGARMGAAAAEHGPDSPEAAAAYARLRTVNVANLAVLFFVVWAMVAQPTL